MAEVDHYEVNTYGNTTYVEPKYREGCLPKIALVVMVVVLFTILRMCGAFDEEYNNEQVGTAPHNRPTLSQSGSTGMDGIDETTVTKEYPDKMNLTELYIFDSECRIDTGEEYIATDAYGNEYDGPYFVFTSYYYGGKILESYAELVTGGEYMYPSGTYFADADYDGNVTTFQIYADGVLVYDSGPITRRTKAIEFDVCINNADTVKVTATSNGSVIHLFLTDAEVRK